MVKSFVELFPSTASTRQRTSTCQSYVSEQMTLVMVTMMMVLMMMILMMMILMMMVLMMIVLML